MATYENVADLLDLIGPLQVMPISTRIPEMYNIKTIQKGPNSAAVALERYRHGSMRDDERDYKLTSSELIFGNLADNGRIDSYNRGTSFVTVTNLLALIFRSDPAPIIQIKEGLVTPGGIVMSVDTDAPNPNEQAAAISTANISAASNRPNAQYRRNVTNVAHARLQDDNGFHLFVYLPPTTFTVDVRTSRSLS
jgi:hypothetical protein